MGGKGSGSGLAVVLFALGAAMLFHYGDRDGHPRRVPADVARDLQAGATGATVEPAANVNRRVAQATGAFAATPPNLPPVDPVDPPELRSNLPADTLFAPDPTARAHFADKLAVAANERHYLAFNRAALTALKPGSTLAVKLPDTGEQVRIRIDEVQVHPNADKSWSGRVIGAGRDVLPVIFTQGVDSSFGSIQTRNHTYSLEAEGRLAWIVDASVLRRHQDFSQSDVRVPDPSRAEPPPHL